jgi:hypothetical protein
MSKDKFMSCPANKEQFIALLCTLADAEPNVETTVARDDGDTVIVQKALEMGQNKSVEVIAEDTDILVLLIHHVTTEHKQVTLRTRAGHYSIQEIQASLSDLQRARLLFIHAFSGCDTVSSIFRQGKVGLFQKLCEDSPNLQDSVFPILLSMDTLQADIIEAGLYLFQFVYGDIMTSLQDHRFTRYSKMLSGYTLPLYAACSERSELHRRTSKRTAKTVLCPEALPPTNGVAT